MEILVASFEYISNPSNWLLVLIILLKRKYTPLLTISDFFEVLFKTLRSLNFRIVKLFKTLL